MSLAWQCLHGFGTHLTLITTLNIQNCQMILCYSFLGQKVISQRSLYFYSPPISTSVTNINVIQSTKTSRTQQRSASQYKKPHNYYPKLTHSLLFSMTSNLPFGEWNVQNISESLMTKGLWAGDWQGTRLLAGTMECLGIQLGFI